MNIAAVPISALPAASEVTNEDLFLIFQDGSTKQFPAASLMAPSVTAADNGKIMVVAGGVWTAGEPPEELPDVTASDNGKVLMVVSGKWAAGTLDLSGKEETSRKVTSITASSTDTEYPSAKAVWTLFNSITNANEVSY